MKASVLLLVMMAMVAIEAHTVSPKDRENCDDIRQAALAENVWAPTCTNKGNFKNKQCDATTCWCVSKKRGRPIFKAQKVPQNHRYDCKRRPKICLKEELSILLGKKKNKRVPDCDCLGYYEKKQCEPVQCKRRKKRDHPVCGTETVVGFEVKDRPNFDNSKEWSFVSKAAFSTDGEVRVLEMQVGNADPNTGLRVGIYRPQTKECEFKLIKQKVFKALAPGRHEIELTGGDIFKVKKGDRYGISWKGGNSGAILYDDVDENRPFDYCEDSQAINVGSTHLFFSNRNGNRQYSVRLRVESCAVPTDEGDCTGTPALLGAAPVSRPLTDTAFQWTMVNTEPFSSNAEIKSIELFVNGEARALRVGIYRPVGGGSCKFQLVQQKEWSGFVAGYAEIKDGGVLFDVQAGDHFGFTWMNYGVIAYQEAGTMNFCDKEQTYEVGDTAELDSINGNRDYSIRMRVTPCLEAKCKECFCVDPMTGIEETGTRTDNEDIECD